MIFLLSICLIALQSLHDLQRETLTRNFLCSSFKLLTYLAAEQGLLVASVMQKYLSGFCYRAVASEKSWVLMTYILRFYIIFRL